MASTSGQDAPAPPLETDVASSQVELSSSLPSTPVSKSETPAIASQETPVADNSQTPQPVPRPDIVVPSYSRWFSFDAIHECEIRSFPELLAEDLCGKNHTFYKYVRNSVVRAFRDNPATRITFTDTRKKIVGDVGSIRKIFDFLEIWGLINYTTVPAKQPLKWEDKDNKLSQVVGDTGRRSFESPVASKSDCKKSCSSCTSPLSIACFANDKLDLALCARCYVRGNYNFPGAVHSDFRRVELSDERPEWSELETLRLLEALVHYGDNWGRVSQHVGSRGEKECIARFLKLPIAEQYAGQEDFHELSTRVSDRNNRDSCGYEVSDAGTTPPPKRARLTPLADASNPIMAQAVFLSAVAGASVADAAAKASITALSDVGTNDPEVSGKNSMGSEEGDDKTEIPLIEMRAILDKILEFEESDLVMEKERKQLEHLVDLLFADQLTLSHSGSLQADI